MADSHLYIGKIPSYNDKINSGGSGINYEDRLKNNLSVVTFEPTGYSISLDTKKDTETGGSANETALKKQSIYKMGKNFKETGTFFGTSITTSSALESWKKMQANVGTTSSANILSKQYESFSIITTNDSTINETISNEFAPNSLNNWGSMVGSMISNDKMKLVADAVKGIGTSMSSQAMLDILSNKDKLSDNQTIQTLIAQAIGIQTALPKIWQRADYNNTSSFTIKLISPSGAPEDVQKFVIQPLILLVLAASPITFDGASYGYPPIWKIEAKGMMKINLAAITAIVITRGGQDTLFNRYNQPTNIDVRLTVEPLVNGFATPLTSGINDIPDPSTNEVNMLVANPRTLATTMSKTTESDVSFQLNPLVLNN